MRNSVSRGGYSTQAHFAQIQRPPLERSVFKRASGHKTTFNAGLLIPIFWDEILPGDVIRMHANYLARLATPIYPYMDNVYLDVHFFFVPNRLVWENWERFNGAQDDPGDSTDFLTPIIGHTAWPSGFPENSIFDYLGLPTKIEDMDAVDFPVAFIPRGINLIWNEWYRDQNLQNSVPVDKSDGPDTTAYTLLPRGRRKDYFTSCLPWPQKGPDVLLPLGERAPLASTTAAPDGGYSVFLRNAVGDQTNLFSDGGSPNHLVTVPPGTQWYWPGSDEAAYNFADLTEATAVTINQIREAFQLQKLFERDARGGTRYIEILLNHFGVVSPDFRLQRPEFIGGGTFNLNVNPVAQTSESGDTPQGELAAYAVANGRVHWNHSFTEHGHVIGLLSVRAETTYQQGMHRAFSRRTRYDYAWPSFAHLGEQAVLNKEIYCQDDSIPNNLVFGYQERYAEYRFRSSMVTGLFRSNAVGSLDAWHLAIDFESLPTLADIVPEAPPIDRIVAVPSQPHFICDSWHDMKHVRALPTYSTPGLVDHF